MENKFDAKKNYYKILGVQSTDTEETIKKAYKKLARVWHPDLNQDNPEAEEKFKEINEAYEVLSNNKIKAEYDKARSGTGFATKSGKTKQRTAPVGKVDLEEMMRNFSASFSEESIKGEADKKSAEKDPFHSDEMFRKFMGFK